MNIYSYCNSAINSSFQFRSRLFALNENSLSRITVLSVIWPFHSKVKVMTEVRGDFAKRGASATNATTERTILEDNTCDCVILEVLSVLSECAVNSAATGNPTQAY